MCLGDVQKAYVDYEVQLQAELRAEIEALASQVTETSRGDLEDLLVACADITEQAEARRTKDLTVSEDQAKVGSSIHAQLHTYSNNIAALQHTHTHTQRHKHSCTHSETNTTTYTTTTQTPHRRTHTATHKQTLTQLVPHQVNSAWEEHEMEAASAQGAQELERIKQQQAMEERLRRRELRVLRRKVAEITKKVDARRQEMHKEIESVRWWACVLLAGAQGADTHAHTRTHTHVVASRTPPRLQIQAQATFKATMKAHELACKLLRTKQLVDSKTKVAAAEESQRQGVGRQARTATHFHACANQGHCDRTRW